MQHIIYHLQMKTTRYVKGSWGQDGTLLGNGGLVKDENTRCISLMSNTISIVVI